MKFLAKINQKIIFLSLALLMTGLFCYWTVAKAQEQDPRIATGVQVSPIRFDWDMNSGDERTGYVNLKNYAKDPYDVEVELEDFYVTNDTTEAKFFVPDAAHPLYAYDVINWIDAPKSVHLEPGEGKDITFQVKVPKETPTGGYYGAIFFKTAVGNIQDGQTSENPNTKIMVHQRVGVLLVMAVKGAQPISLSGILQKFSPLKKIFWSQPANLITEVLNNGNLHFKVLGNIDLYKFGKKMDSLSIEPRVVYPGKFRHYENNWDFSAWAYGYYTAKLDLVSENGQIKISGATSFWVIPWKTTLAILILLIIIYLIYHIFTKKFEIRKKTDE